MLEVIDRRDEGGGSADHAMLVVSVQVLDVVILHRLAKHDRQAVDDDVALQHKVARLFHRRPGIVGAVARNIDDAAMGDYVVRLDQFCGAVERI